MRQFALFEDGAYVGSFNAEEISKITNRSSRCIYDGAKSGRLIAGKYQVSDSKDIKPAKDIKKVALWDNEHFVGLYGRNEAAEIVGVDPGRISDAKVRKTKLKKRWYITDSEKENPHIRNAGCKPQKYKLYHNGIYVCEGTSKELSEKLNVCYQNIVSAANHGYRLLSEYTVMRTVKKKSHKSHHKVHLEKKEPVHKIKCEVPFEQKSPLAKDAYLARMAGKSYGQWKALENK